MNFTDKEKKRLLQHYGSWAVVTGASSGIGLELTERLAEAGFNIIINARDEYRLTAVKESLEKKYHSKIIVVAADCGEAAGTDKIIAAAKGLQVGLLVACAGFGTSGQFSNSELAMRSICFVSIARDYSG